MTEVLCASTVTGAGGTWELLSSPLFSGILAHLIHITALRIPSGIWGGGRLTTSLCRDESWNPDIGPSGLYWEQRPG